jgi:Tol biopolymer transport system component
VWAALLAAMAAALVVVLTAGMESAKAAFPGSNGAIAFDNTSQVYRMNSDGFGQTQLSDTAGGFNPAWSSDGKKITFQSERDGNAEIYRMRATDGANQINLTSTGAANEQNPSWQPDP